MDFTLNMGYLSAAMLIPGAVAFGVTLYLNGNAHTDDTMGNALHMRSTA